MWIDTHCHLNDPVFKDDYRLVLETALRSRVGAMVVVGFDLESSRRAVGLAQEFEPIYAAVGIHPQDADTWNEAVASQIQQMLTEPKVVALGEIGLDYHYDDSPSKAEQKQVFAAQLQMAKQLQKPVIIHNREAHQDTLIVLKSVQLGPAGGVMHCFSGSREIARQWLAMGLYLSFAGPLTFTNARQVREVARTIPLDRLLIETDSPYLAPHPKRGQRNEPGLVGLVGEKLAEIKGKPLTDVMTATTTNAQKLFELKCVS
ncbi:MAG: TatD family hydrolase [Bacillota bacterium]|jgi:TatD DNase family protein